MFAGHFDFSIPFWGEVPQILSPAECQALLATGGTWLEATVNSAAGRTVKKNIRDNTLLLLPDPEPLARTVYARLAPHLPKTFQEKTLWGLVPSLRIYRYEAGQHFGVHQDQSYQHQGRRSELTLLVYLNDDFEGGETEFLQPPHVVTPRTGVALWFQHRLEHRGCPVTRGTKYLLRTDVLYD